VRDIYLLCDNLQVVGTCNVPHGKLAKMLKPRGKKGGDATRVANGF